MELSTYIKTCKYYMNLDLRCAYIHTNNRFHTWQFSQHFTVGEIVQVHVYTRYIWTILPLPILHSLTDCLLSSFSVDSRKHVVCLFTYMNPIFCPAWLCQQSSWNRNLSVVRPSVSQLSLDLMHGFLSIFGCCFLSLSHTLGCFFEKKNLIFYEYFLFSLT